MPLSPASLLAASREPLPPLPPLDPDGYLAWLWATEGRPGTPWTVPEFAMVMGMISVADARALVKDCAKTARRRERLAGLGYDGLHVPRFWRPSGFNWERMFRVLGRST